MQVREIFEIEHYEKQKKKRNVCAYARVSTTKDLQYTSYEYQVKTYTELITANENWNFIGVYADEGKSGTNITYRDNFRLMIQLATSGFIDLIITKSISRFARNVVDCLRVVQELKRHNVEVYFETDNISSFDPKIEFVISLLASMAEEESKNTSENVKWNVRSRFAEGKFYAVSKRILGYDNADDGSLIINENEAKIVKHIFNAYTTGTPVAEICDQLNHEGIKTKFSKKVWDSTAVLGILKNEKYTGNALLQKTLRPDFRNKNLITKTHDLPMYYVQNSHQAIIPIEQFKEAEKIRLKRIEKYHSCTNEDELKEKFNVRSEYAGLITCGTCGKTYRFKRNNIGTPYEKRILKCASNKGKKTCVNNDIFCDTFDEVLMNQINLILKNKNGFIKALELAFNKHPLVIEAKEKLTETQGKMMALKSKSNHYVDSNDEYDNKILEELRDQINLMNKTVIEIENSLITTLNVKNKVKILKNVISELPAFVENVNEVDYNLIFNDIVIHENKTIDFKIRFADTESKKNEVIFSGNVEYFIRKTKHKLKHRIVIV
ncbi:recombinase family protein [Liberiplasma polymorphum]|uniref:recombinase family protein n=1 Tax=Liberiplasma polymorphum TaxID=3374570 RepID=UPI00377689BC